MRQILQVWNEGIEDSLLKSTVIRKAHARTHAHREGERQRQRERKGAATITTNKETKH